MFTDFTEKIVQTIKAEIGWVLFFSSLVFTASFTGIFSLISYVTLVPVLFFFSNKKIISKDLYKQILLCAAGAIVGITISLVSRGNIETGQIMTALIFVLFFIIKIYAVYLFRKNDKVPSMWLNAFIFAFITVLEYAMMSVSGVISIYSSMFDPGSIAVFSPLAAAALNGIVVLVNGMIMDIVLNKRVSIALFPFTLFLAFPSYQYGLLGHYSFFAFAAFVPLCFGIRELPLKKVYIRLVLSGLAANIITYGWMGSFGNTVSGGSFILLSVFMPTLSVILAAKFTLAEYLARRYPNIRLLVFPVVLLGFDYLQSWGYLAFPWTYIGYSQFENLSMLYLSSVTGIFGVIFVLHLSNTLIADMIYRIQKESALSEFLIPEKSLALVLMIMVIAVSTIPGFFVPDLKKDVKKGNTLRVSLIQTCISPWDNWAVNSLKFLSILTDQTDIAIDDGGSDLIIWSESATLEPVSHAYRAGRVNRFINNLFMYVKSRAVPLFTAEIGLYYKKTGYYYTNSACIVEASGAVNQVYDKIHLAPIGEWFPYERLFPGLKRFLESMGSSSFVPGKEPRLMNIKEFSFGPLICYEGMFHRLNRRYRKMGADFFVNITNDGWSEYFSGHMQHYAASPFRAAENGLWYVRVGNTGYTAVIDPYGRVAASIPIMDVGYLNYDLPAGEKVDTLFVFWGDFVIYLIFGITAVLVIFTEIKSSDFCKRKG